MMSTRYLILSSLHLSKTEFVRVMSDRGFHVRDLDGVVIIFGKALSNDDTLTGLARPSHHDGPFKISCSVLLTANEMILFGEIMSEFHVVMKPNYEVIPIP
jgi:hypothetical protein